MTTTPRQDDAIEMKKLGQYILNRAYGDEKFMEWLKGFGISETYYEAIINPYSYTEFILNEKYNNDKSFGDGADINKEYESNRDIGDAIIDYIDDNKLSEGMTDERYDEIVGIVWIARQTGMLPHREE